MARSEKQKAKLLYILKILKEETDESNFMPMHALIARLEFYGILAERKSIYSDIRVLQDFGYDILINKSKNNGGYAIGEQEFELVELKLLVDAVQSSRFITKNKTLILIKKLERFTSQVKAKQLQRQVYVAKRVKAENEKIYYNVDCIHSAIQNNKKVSFTYFEWTVKKEMRGKKEGAQYVVSPWALTFNEENYYLIAYDGIASKIKHYRVDKMLNIAVVDLGREGMELYKNFDLAETCNKTFGMFGGVEEVVTLRLPNAYVGVVIDRFGKEISLRELEDDHFSVRVKVAISPPFYGWLAGLGIRVQITAPEYVKNEYIQYLENIVIATKGV